MPLRLMLRHRFLRFLLVGVMNATFSYSVYALFLFAGLQFALANFLALLAGIMFSFQTQGRLVFGNTKQRLIWRYAFFWGVLYLCNIALIKLMLMNGLNAYSAGALALPVITILSYFIQKLLVFQVRSS